MLFLIVEHYRDGDPLPVYRRFREQGRLAPEGLQYVASWVTEDLRRCYQVMECADRALLDAWMARWEDLVEFEVSRSRSPGPACRRRDRRPGGRVWSTAIRYPPGLRPVKRKLPPLSTSTVPPPAGTKS